VRPTWEILIASLQQRSERLRELLDVLLPQTEPYAGEVKVHVLLNRGERPLSHVRQELVHYACGYYTSFVDDDDAVPPYFVERVMTCLEERPDYVGWRMQCYVDGEPLKPTFHSLRYGGWFEDEHGYYRDVSHLNPTIATVVDRVDFRRGDPPEDVAWSTQVRALNALKTECYVDDVMYYYRSSPADSTWRGEGVRPNEGTPLVVDHPHFAYNPRSSHL